MSPRSSVRTRFAPSPTGDLHLGGAWTALASWVVSRRAGGVCTLRFEDLDADRRALGARERIEDDLRWLGLDWDEAPLLQSERTESYARALAALTNDGLVYPCDCSRAEISRAASAPHAGEETVYSGRCRALDPARTMRRPPAMRVRVPDQIVEYEDQGVGKMTQNLARDVGDFVLRRGDGIFAYQLAVVVDDVAMHITDVVRGADLVASTPRQIWLARALRAETPRYLHVAIVVGSDGTRLAKRTRPSTVRELRVAGVSSRSIVGALAHGLGLMPTPAPVTPLDVVRATTGNALSWRTSPWSPPAFP